MYINFIEETSIFSRWWNAWTDYSIHVFNIDDDELELLNVIFIAILYFAIVYFIYKIVHLRYEELPAFKVYCTRVIQSEIAVDSLVNAIATIVDFKKNSISAAGYKRIRNDCKSAEALLNYLAKKERAENYIDEQFMNDGEYTEKLSTEIETEFKLHEILSEAACCDDTLRKQVSPYTKSITKPLTSILRSSLCKETRKRGTSLSVRFMLPNEE